LNTEINSGNMLTRWKKIFSSDFELWSSRKEELWKTNKNMVSPPKENFNGNGRGHGM
jgi:hypothetical protein